MNLNDTLIEMLENGFGKITIGTSPNKLPFVAGEQVVKTGDNGDQVIIYHQREARSITECVNKIYSDMLHCRELKPENPRS